MKHLFILLFISASALGYSQNWVFRITPTVKSTIGFYNSSYSFEENNLFTFSQSKRSAFGNMAYDFNPHMDVFVDLYEWKKWTFGIGFGRMASYSQSKFDYSTTYLIPTSNGFKLAELYIWLYHMDSKEFRQLSFSVKKEFTPLNHRTRHFLSAQFNLGYNYYDSELNTSSLTSKSFDEIYYDILYETNFEGLGKSKRFQMGISLRYEIAINSRKGKNLFNVNFTYHQGFLRTTTGYARFDFSVPALMEGNAVAEALSTSRNATFGFGLSKTFSFNLFKNEKNKL
jgi:hypothetical protein